MKLRYGCVCFAVPKKMLRHLVDTSQGEHREMLASQIQQSSQLRGQRAAASTQKTVVVKRGAKSVGHHKGDIKPVLRQLAALLDEDPGVVARVSRGEVHDVWHFFFRTGSGCRNPGWHR